MQIVVTLCLLAVAVTVVAGRLTIDREQCLSSEGACHMMTCPRGKAPLRPTGGAPLMCARKTDTRGWEMCCVSRKKAKEVATQACTDEGGECTEYRLPSSGQWGKNWQALVEAAEKSCTDAGKAPTNIYCGKRTICCE